jgi:peptidase E
MFDTVPRKALSGSAVFLSGPLILTVLNANAVFSVKGGNTTHLLQLVSKL